MHIVLKQFIINGRGSLIVCYNIIVHLLFLHFYSTEILCDCALAK